MKKRIWILIASVIFSVFLLPFTLPQPSRLWVLSVGQGESILFRDSKGVYLLFDGGPDQTVLSELGRILPPWQRTIHIVALSHKHSDHIRGLIAVIERYNVLAIWESGVSAKGNDVRQFNEVIERKQIPRTHPYFGNSYAIGRSKALVLHPITSKLDATVKDQHDATLVLQIQTETTRILLTGDIDAKHEREILKACALPACTLESTVLQVPHHGSATGLSPPFLAAIQPKLALICVGQNNRYRHPRSEIIERLTRAEVPIHRTDQDGGLVLTFRKGSLSYEKSGSAPR